MENTLRLGNTALLPWHWHIHDSVVVMHEQDVLRLEVGVDQAEVVKD